jgi:hypothetical protein
MAIINLAQLRTLVANSKDWEGEGLESPTKTLGIELQQGDAGGVSFAEELSGKTVTYEGRDATVVLDFDEQGYLISIEIV